MKKKDWLIIGFFFLLAYFLRVMYLPQGVLTFGYDQARDAVISQQILAGDLKILGPPASTPGLFHGVFYYYFLSLGYLFGKNPINAAYWVALFNAATVFIVACLSYLMTKKKMVAFVAAFLFAISFEATQYATWLSNPTIGIWTVPLMYLGLWLWTQEKNKWGPLMAAVGLGLSIQAEIFLLYHSVPLLIWLSYSKGALVKKKVGKFILGLIIALSTLILAEIKFGFKGISGLKALVVQGGSLAYADSLGDYLILYLNQVGRIFAFNSYPGNIGYGGALVMILALIAVFRLKKKWGKFLALWLFSHMTVVTVGGTSTPFLMVGIGPAVSILLAVFITSWWQKSKTIALLVLLILAYGSLTTIAAQNSRGSTLFAIQGDMLLAKQRELVGWTYEKAQGSAFSINSLTSPLDINIVWAYLYQNAEESFGYAPCFSGRDQIGQVIALATCSKKENHFLILEPMGGIPARFLELKLGEEDVDSVATEELSWGELRVQKREQI